MTIFLVKAAHEFLCIDRYVPHRGKPLEEIATYL